MDVRRVVTGHDAAGKAVFVSDDRVAPVRPALLAGTEFHQLWGGDETARFPDDGALPDAPRVLPAGRRVPVRLVHAPAGRGPGVPADLDVPAALGELEEVLPGLAGHMDPADPGMHTTATIDFEVVLSGEVALELDGGATVRLGPGDTVVQNGTRHRWSNPGTEPAVLAVCIIGAHHARVP